MAAAPLARGEKVSSRARGRRWPILDVHNVKQRDLSRSRSTHARQRPRGGKRRLSGGGVPVWRAHGAPTPSRALRRILRALSLLPVGGGFGPPPVNPVCVLTLVGVDRSPIATARPSRARPAVRSVG